MFLLAIAGWISGVVVSLVNGNRKFPLTILLLGIGLMLAPIGLFRIAGIALLAAIIWIGNKWGGAC
jgi:hypothetical protein